MALTDQEVRERVSRIDASLERVESIADVSARDASLDAVQQLLDLYGEGLARIVGHVADVCDDDAAAHVAHAFAEDELVSHLLLLHGLHPDGLREPVEESPHGREGHSTPVLVPLRRAGRPEHAAAAAS